MLEDDVEVTLGHGGVVLAGPFDLDVPEALECAQERSFGNVPRDASKKHLARQSRVPLAARGQMAGPSVGGFVQRRATAVKASRPFQGHRVRPEAVRRRIVLIAPNPALSNQKVPRFVVSAPLDGSGRGCTAAVVPEAVEIDKVGGGQAGFCLVDLVL